MTTITIYNANCQETIEIAFEKKELINKADCQRFNDIFKKRSFATSILRNDNRTIYDLRKMSYIRCDRQNSIKDKTPKTTVEIKFFHAPSITITVSKDINTINESIFDAKANDQLLILKNRNQTYLINPEKIVAAEIKSINQDEESELSDIEIDDEQSDEAVNSKCSESEMESEISETESDASANEGD